MSDSDNTAAPEDAPIDWPNVAEALATRPRDGAWNIPQTVLPRGDHADAADLLLEVVRTRYSNVVACDGELYGYDAAAGIFVPLERDLERIVKGFAGRVTVESDNLKQEPKPLRVFTGLARGAIQFARAEVSRPGFFEDAPHGVAFSDGFVIVEPNDIQLVPHSPSHRARHAYSFPFAGSHASAKYVEYLYGLFRDDHDRQAKIDAFQEMLGAALTGLGPQYERALLLLGGGSNGKTELIGGVVSIMPRGSVSGLPPSLWGDQYARPILRGALVNVEADLTTAELGGAVKSVITGELLTARVPGSAPFQFRPCALHLFGCNALPSTSDTSDGFFRRWLILTLNRSFKDDPAREIRIHDRLVRTELPGIVRWGLEGATRLLGGAEYTLPPSHHLAIAEWRGTVDAPALFIEACTEAAGFTGAAELYAAFTEWARPHGVTMKAKAFGTALESMGLKLPRSADGARYAVQLKAETNNSTATMAA